MTVYNQIEIITRKNVSPGPGPALAVLPPRTKMENSAPLSKGSRREYMLNHDICYVTRLSLVTFSPAWSGVTRDIPFSRTMSCFSYPQGDREKDLLKKCLHGRTQNPNESFNKCIWERIPKTVFVGIETLKFGVMDAIICFNDGYIYIATHGRKRLRSPLGGAVHKSIQRNRPELPQSFELSSNAEEYGTFYKHQAGSYAPNLRIGRRKIASR
ncbi:uncharacterized protein TNCV_1921111 [Trichonephila clavipes]|nr:uncharacterized protein TNCV_1921111 [Trichonephila clavipes]